MQRKPRPSLPPVDASPRLREVFGGGPSSAPTLVPELVMLGWSRFTRAKLRGLAPHRHENAWEICFLVDGKVDWWVEDAGVFEVKRGDWFVTRPNQLHGGSDTVMHPCELFWAQFTLPLPDLDAGAARNVAAHFDPIPAGHFPADENVPALFASLMHEHRGGGHANTESGAQPLALSAFAVRTLLHQLLVLFLRDYARFAALEANRLPTALTDGNASPEIRVACDWMRAHLTEPFVVEAVARAVGLGSARFHERFLQEVGLPPAEWRARERVHEAQRLLQNPAASVTEIAFALGFPSSQHFATVFKKYTGRTPTQFRERHSPGLSPRPMPRKRVRPLRSGKGSLYRPSILRNAHFCVI